MTIVAPGEFEYRLSYDGDGRVPHDLGLASSDRHDLLRWTKCMAILRGATKQVLRAVDELLETGTTRMNCQRRSWCSAVRAVPTMRDYRSAADLAPDGGARADRRQGEGRRAGRRH